MRYTTRIKTNVANRANILTHDVFIKRKLVVAYPAYYALLVEIFSRPANYWVVTCLCMALVARKEDIATFELDGYIIYIGMIMLAPAVVINELSLNFVLFKSCLVSRIIKHYALYPRYEQ